MFKHLAVFSTAFVIAGCDGGDAEAANAGDGATAGGNASVAGAATNAATNAATGAMTATPLPTTPINFADAMGRTPPSIKETVPCPFLTDETARRTATTEYVLTRRSVSNTECVWNYNLGFSVRARVEPLAGARPFSARTYNMDIPPVLQSQSSPGKNAVVLADSTFGAPRPYAFGFDLGDKRVFVRITGMRTSLAQLQPAAEEIARTLPNAPQIEPQVREEKGAFDLCTTWTKESLRTLFDQPESATVAITASRKSCEFKVYFARPSRNVVTIGLGIMEEPSANFEFLKTKGWTEASGYAHPALTHASTDQFGANTLFRGFINDGSVSVNVMGKDGAQDAAAKALFANVLTRIVP